MKKNKKVEIFEGDRATHYDNFIHHFFPNYDFVMKSIPMLVKGMLSSVAVPRILVVGAGTGNEVKKIAAIDDDWKIDACDPSEEMIIIAKNKLATYKNISLYQCTIEELPTTNSYDVITLLLVLHFLSDDGEKENLLREIYNRLETGGSLIVFDICGTREELEQNFKILSHSFPDNWSQEEKDMRKQRILNVLNVISEERFKSLAEKAGFDTVVKFHQSTITKAWILTKN
ncbi:MAG: class I SAM-dependent methyltransferase [Bacteroidota bacterium]